MNKHVFLPITLLLLFLSLNTFAQRSDKRVYTDSGWWTLGLTGGAAWQGSDICAIPGWGVGIDLAKNIYHRPQGLLDLDLRGRLLYTQTYGADHERSYGILDNPALNGTNNPDLNYTSPTGPGFTFMNHKTHLGEASIEAVLTANRLRENTGVILQGFGGLGLNGYQTYMNQLNNSDEMYDWSEIDTDRRRLDILSQTGTYGFYETPANDYDNAPRISVMPSLGLGLGYQLTRNFSIGLEHKTNWALHDNLEGQQYNREDNTLSTNNDLHHYTSLYLRWRIGDRYKKESNPVIYNESIEDEKGMTTYSPPVESYGNAPIITFTKPSKEVSTVSNDRISVAASIEHINGQKNIEATFNGKPLTSYTYNPGSDRFVSVLVLEQGSNEIVITATNEFGKDVESRTINFKPNMNGVVTAPPSPPSTPKPTVDITRPTSNPYTSNQQTVSLKADVKNVDSKRDITFKINGKRTYNFDLDGYFGNTITADIPLETETTNVSITVRNASGSDTDTQKIRYTGYCPPGGYTDNDNSGLRPDVRITSPSASTYNSTESTVPVTATIKNVNSKNNITFTVNGQRKTNFNYNSSSDKFTANVVLNGERTEVIIRAINNEGNDSDDLTIVYCPPTPRPQVTITKPMNNRTTRNGSEPVKATVTNVNSKSDISVKINNQSVYNFDYSNSRNEVTFTANLQPGNNTIRIKATNLAGSDNDDVVVNYNAVERPEVDIIKPNSDPYTSTNPSVGIVAVVQNVGSKNDITFKVNGRTTRSFNYSESSGKVTANINLENGNNTVYIKATNEAGNDSDDTVIKYNKPRNPVVTTIKTPTVKITQPHASPFTVSSEQVAILATIKNVTSSRNITFKVNGKTIRNFDYSPKQNAFEGLITLKEGQNNIVITASNSGKTASDNTVLIYERGESQDQFGTTYNDIDDDGNKTTTNKGTKSNRSRFGGKNKGEKDSDNKKSTRKSRGN